jgi:hypothetical protein
MRKERKYINRNIYMDLMQFYVREKRKVGKVLMLKADG